MRRAASILAVVLMAGAWHRLLATGGPGSQGSPATPAAPPNVWVRLEQAQVGQRSGPALVYDAAGKQFLCLGGGIEWRAYNRRENPFDDLALDPAAGVWENLFPPGKDWGPKVGNATPPPFKDEHFALVDSQGNVRPNVSAYRGVFYYNQYALDTDRRRVYFFARGHTFAYDPAARAWKDLAPATDPAGGRGKPPLLWGAMCYDPVSRKALLFGGGNVMSERGDPGTWMYDPDANTWSPLTFQSAALDAPARTCADLHARAKRLAEALRQRYYRAELPEEAAVDLAEVAGGLTSGTVMLLKGLEAAGAKADDYEKRQVAWARPHVEAAAAGLNDLAGKAKTVTATLIRTADAARDALGAASDALALEPPQRALSPMVYDPATKQILLFGGDQLDRLLADTWAFDCAARRWMQKRPAVGPAPRAGHALVYLPAAKRALLVGGFTYTSTTDYCGAQYRTLPFEMWTYDSAKDEWSLLKRVDDARTVPGRSLRLPAAADADDLVVAIHGTETWACRVDAAGPDAAGTAERGVKPGATAERTGPYVPAFYDEAPPSDPAAAEAALAALPGNTWVRLKPPRQPTVDRCWGTAVLDTDRDLIMHWSGGHSSHCGTEVVRYHVGLDRWSLAAASEQPLEFVYSNDGTPGQWSFKRRPWMTGHTYKSYGYDPVLKRMLFAGKGGLTYVFDPGAGDWEPRTIANPFDGNMYVATLAATPKGAVVWAVSADRVSTALWRMDPAAQTWKPLPLKGVLPRASPDRHGMAYDSKRDRLLFFSNVDPKTAGDVAEYVLATGEARWLAPPGRERAALPSRETIYIPEADMVMVGAHVRGGNGASLWPIYDCAKNAWVGADLAGADPVGKGAFNVSLGLVYDPKRKLVWALGQHSEVTVLRFAPGSARLVPLAGSPAD